MPSNGDKVLNGLRPLWSRWSRPWASSERRAAATSYVQGLLMPGQRKSIEEPMANRLGVPSQRLQQFVADSPWDQQALWRVIRRQVLPHLEPVEAWIVDETGWR
jgi:SRSO17 transposase